MKKIGLGILSAVVILAIAGIVSASMLIPAADRAKERAKAPEKSSVITETEAGEWGLERVDFVHYAKPPKPPKGPKAETCYKLLRVKWKTLPVDYVVNPTNPDGLPKEFITGAISISAETWDVPTASELFNDVYTVDYSAQYGVQNFENVMAFGDYPDDNVIAVTSIWYTRKGRQIVEFDILFDTDYTWGDATANPAVMDLQNIVTHELGHGAGLGDIYSTACSEVTMYGYSTEGEIKKRTLEGPDVTGIQKLYGQ